MALFVINYHFNNIFILCFEYLVLFFHILLLITCNFRHPGICSFHFSQYSTNV